jgi:hypothetical protein
MLRIKGVKFEYSNKVDAKIIIPGIRQRNPAIRVVMKYDSFLNFNLINDMYIAVIDAMIITDPSKIPGLII